MPMDDILGRKKFGNTYKNNSTPHLGTQAISTATFSATPAKCTAFMGELQHRKKSFDRIRRQVLITFAVER